MKRHNVKWPKGQLLACTFRVAYEAFHGSGRFKKDAKIMVNQASLSHVEYGGRVGIWRLMEIFDRNDVKASINLNGLAIEMWPDSVKGTYRLDADHSVHTMQGGVMMRRIEQME